MKLTALLYFVLSLFGVDIGGSTFVTRSSVDGADVLHSRATARAGVARFECLRSASGQCHYTVYPPDCAPPSDAPGKNASGCSPEPLKRFALADGESRQVSGLHEFRLCVSVRPGIPMPDCRAPEPTATR